MAMAMAMTVAAFPPPPGFYRKRLRGSPAQLPSLLCCCCSSQQEPAAEAFFSRGRVVKVVTPILAAAIVGFTGMIAHAEEWRSFLMPVSNLEAGAGQDSYRILLEKIKEGRQKNLSPQVGESLNSVEKEDSSTTSISPVQKLKTAAESARSEREKTTQKLGFGQSDKQTKDKPSPVAAAKPQSQQVEASSKSTVVKSEKKNTHGFLPLFVAQFLLLLATIGGGAVLLLPELQKKLNDNLEKASPFVEGTYKQLQPLTIQAWEKAQELGTQARPYILQAWKGSKPVALKTFEALKPFIKETQTKATDLFQQAQEKAKSLNRP